MITNNRLLAKAVIAVLTVGVSSGQVKKSVITLDSPRPLAVAADRLEELSAVPVNYEDSRYENRTDVQDVTDSVARRPLRPGVRILVPRGGPFTFEVPTDAVTGRLVDVQAGLNALLAAHLSSGYPGSFAVENVDGAYSVTPVQGSVLAALITLPLESRTPAETLELILKQVSNASGFRVNVGMVPLNAMLNMRREIGATGEPARDVLLRLFTAICSVSALRPPPTMSYRLFFDPGFKQYALNIHSVPNRFREIPVEPTPKFSSPARWMHKKPAGVK